VQPTCRCCAATSIFTNLSARLAHSCSSELLAIRHCVFLMGPTGCGRSEVVRVLARAIAIGAQTPTNPYLQANNKKKASCVGQLVMASQRAASTWWLEAGMVTCGSMWEGVCR